MAAIDIDRGVMIRDHQKLGMNIYMYLDDPGQYLTAHGTPVPATLAKEAGFDTLRLGKEREKRSRMDQAKAAIEKELSGIELTEKVTAEKGDFKVVNMGLGRFKVRDKDGNDLHEQMLDQEHATGLMNQLAAEVKK